MQKQDVKHILTRLRVNYPATFSKMTIQEKNVFLENWSEGLKEIDSRFAEQACKYYLFNTSRDFAPTIGEFIERCEIFRREEKEKKAMKPEEKKKDDNSISYSEWYEMHKNEEGFIDNIRGNIYKK